MRFPILSLRPRAPRVRLSAVTLTALCAPLFFAGLCAAQTSSQNVVLTFEGLQDQEEVLNYYNGGLGGDLSGPGPKYGITFGSDAHAVISGLDRGSGQFSGNPSGITTVSFQTGPGVVMNVPGGFTAGFSFYYASGNLTGTVTVYDVNNNQLQQVALQATGSGCDTTGEPFDCWQQAGASFSGVATSVDFSGATNGIGFDNITLGSSTASKGCGLVINTNSLTSGTVGTPYNQALSASNCTPPYHWKATGLPSWAQVTDQTSTTGLLSGKPDAVGTSYVTLTVTDSSDGPVSYTTPTPLPLVINQNLTITTTSLTGGTAGFPYNQTLTATGGTLPYNWTASGLPGWAQVTNQTSTTGLLSGSNPTAGASSVILKVTDSSTPPLSYTTPTPLPLVINQNLTITTTSLTGGTAGSPYNQTLTATGGTPPYNWTASGLPAWAQVTNQTSTTGLLSGSNPTAGASSVTLTVTDSSIPQLSYATPMALPLVITPPKLAITTTSLSGGTVGTAYSQTLNATGGTPPYNWTASGLPSWASVTSSNGTFAITGMPDAAATSHVILTVTDNSSPQLTQTSPAYPLVIASPPAPSLQITPSVTQITAIANSASVTVTLGSAAPADLTATLTLSFAGTAAGLPSGNYADPKLLFGQGGTTTTLVVSSGSTSASLPANNAIQVGSVAGTITVTITGLTETINGQQQALVLPNPNPSATIAVPALAPAITSVNIINVTASSFTVDIVASSVSRDLSGVNLTFSPAQGATLTGTSFSYSGSQMSTPASNWFSSQDGLTAGGAFDLQIPFTFSGNTSAIGSVSVTLTNSAGTSSAVSGQVQ